MKTYQVNKEGYYGEFGGAYIPEILHRCVEELKNAYSKVLESEEFKKNSTSYYATMWDALHRFIRQTG